MASTRPRRSSTPATPALMCVQTALPSKQRSWARPVPTTKASTHGAKTVKRVTPAGLAPSVTTSTSGAMR